jgi:three-Cys-motif partner protein
MCAFFDPRGRDVTVSRTRDEAPIDPDDGMPVEEVGPWAVADKHALVRSYVDLTHGPRKRYLGAGKAGSCLLDLYCSFGRVIDRESKVISDGGALSAWKKSVEKGSPFSKVILGDLEPERVDVCRTRLERVQAPVVALKGPAAETVESALANVHPAGLHLAYLDPYNITALPFSVIERLAKRLQRVDFIIHFSTSDLQRNLDRFIAAESSPLDTFAPGWRDSQVLAAQHQQRQLFFDYWIGLTAGLGFKVGRIRHVKGGNNQTLYYLVYLSRHPLGKKLWDVTENDQDQWKLI